jgi:chorismate--pyruvate lyase
VSQTLFPELLHDALRYRSGAGRLAPWRVPPALRPWLLDAGSLTRRLVQVSNGHFRVEVLRQGYLPTLPVERQELGLGMREWPFVREVLLRCHDQPWVFARTLIPRTTLQGRVRGLTHLGTKPLGAVLFSDPQVRRGPIAVARLQPARLGLDLPAATPLWGRRSVFYISGLPLLVSEYFLPDCPLYQQTVED